MPKFNLCIVECKCFHKVWGFRSGFILTIAEACLGLIDSLTKAHVPVCLFFVLFLNLPRPAHWVFSYYYFNGRWWEMAKSGFPVFFLSFQLSYLRPPYFLYKQEICIMRIWSWSHYWAILFFSYLNWRKCVETQYCFSAASWLRCCLPVLQNYGR